MAKSVGPYQLLAPLSEGGMAQIYLVRRSGATTLCALKRLRHSLAANSIAQKRLIREAQITAQLDHPNIGRTIDAGFDEQGFYIVMELIRGQDLRELLDAGGLLSAPLVIGIACQILDALAYAHGLQDAEGQPLNIVHRDLALRNIMVTYDGQLKLIDFGIAKADARHNLTATGVLLGTPHYMSPEQAMSEPVDLRSDLYSLSVILYELLTGEKLVSGIMTIEALMQVINTEPPPIDTKLSGLPKGFKAVLKRGLEKNRDHRWPSAVAYRQALIETGGGESNVQSILRDRMETFFSEAQKRQNEWLQKYEVVSEEYHPTVAANIIRKPSLRFISASSQPHRVAAKRQVGFIGGSLMILMMSGSLAFYWSLATSSGSSRSRGTSSGAGDASSPQVTPLAPKVAPALPAPVLPRLLPRSDTEESNAASQSTVSPPVTSKPRTVPRKVRSNKKSRPTGQARDKGRASAIRPEAFLSQLDQLKVRLAKLPKTEARVAAERALTEASVKMTLESLRRAEDAVRRATKERPPK